MKTFVVSATAMIFAAVAGYATGEAIVNYQSRHLGQGLPTYAKVYAYPTTTGKSATDRTYADSDLHHDFTQIHEQIKDINAGIDRLRADRDYWMNKALDPRCDVWGATQ